MRLFVSVDIPYTICLDVSSLSSAFPSKAIKPVSPDRMHLTLKFVGEVPDYEFVTIADSLYKIRFKPFDVLVKGVGVFPKPEFVKVVWAGIDSPGLVDLASKVKSSLKKYGNEEKFHPHLTIARVKKRIDVSAFLKEHIHDEFGRFKVNSFNLMQSRLTPRGPEYSVLATYISGEGND